MTLLTKNADCVEATIQAVREVIPDFKRTELHLNVGHESGHYFDNLGQAQAVDHQRVARAIADHRDRLSRKVEIVVPARRVERDSVEDGKFQCENQ